MQPRLMILSCVAAALMLAAGTAQAQERLAPTVVPYTPTFSFGMIGLGTGSTARLNVVNLVRIAPPVAVALIACKVELDLYDGQGKLIKQKNITNLGFGQADFLDLLRSEVAATGAHVEITGVVKVGSGQAFFCNVSATLEVFDSVTGVTSAILTGTNAVSPFVLSPLTGTPQPTLP